MPKAAIVMSVYNFNRTPMRGIETMLSQTFKDFEFIIVDGGSEEKVRIILAGYAAKDKRIKLVAYESRVRLASSLNRAIALTDAPYIARADVNISYHPQRLEKQISFLEEHSDIDIVGSNFYWGIDGREQEKAKEIILPQSHNEIVCKLSEHCCICHPSVVFRREKLIVFGPYKEGFGCAEDYHLWMRVRDKVKFHNLQEFLLVKWHRPPPVWKDRRDITRLGYVKGDLLSRLAGFSTTPNIWSDIVWFPMVLYGFVSETWLHNALKVLAGRTEGAKSAGDVQKA
jgi:glycosyltransferase involved in cell wall biosynthesis